MVPSPRAIVRREAGIFALERALQRRGFLAVAGADEAGRGACAGPLVVAAAILPTGKRGEVPGLADSKLLTAAARERVYGEIVARAASYAVVVIPAGDVDRLGLQVCNLSGMRRALAALAPHPDYVLTDGFGVSGLGAPALAVWKGDRVAACIAAASVVAKVTRDRIMVDMDSRFPGYGFAEHKGYSTEDHMAALAEHGPCPEHRFSYVNVAAAKLASGELGEAAKLASGESDEATEIPSGPVSFAAVSDEVVTAGRRRRRSTVSVATGDTPILAGVASDQGREGRTG